MNKINLKAAKIIYKTKIKLVIQHFKDDATAFNNKKAKVKVKES